MTAAAAMLLRERGRGNERDARRQDRKGQFAHAEIPCRRPRASRAEPCGRYPTPRRCPCRVSRARRCAKSRQPASSASSNRAGSGLSRSITPSSAPSTTIGTTSSEREAASQAIWPGKAWTSSTRCGCERRRRRAADALAERNADAGRPPLERPEHQLAADIAVEAGPVEVRQRLEEQGRDIGHVGDRVRLVRGQRVGGRVELPPELGLVRRLDPEVVHQSEAHLPRPCLIEPRCFLASTRFALAARLGLVGRRLAGLTWALLDQFRQPRPRILAIGLLRPVFARGDHDLAGRGHPAPGQRLQPRIDVGREAELEDVAAQLAGGRDLVDVLPARPGRGQEAFFQRVFGKLKRHRQSPH